LGEAGISSALSGRTAQAGPALSDATRRAVLARLNEAQELWIWRAARMYGDCRTDTAGLVEAGALQAPAQQMRAMLSR
jgi:hypothetical protein